MMSPFFKKISGLNATLNLIFRYFLSRQPCMAISEDRMDLLSNLMWQIFCSLCLGVVRFWRMNNSAVAW